MSVPGVTAVDRFSQKLRGSFGRFHTASSFSLHYLSTTLHVEDIGNLCTASEVFDPESTAFEELIQRDIDQARVIRIATEYLSRGKDRVIFFPPLLVCVAIVTPDERLKPQYDVVEAVRNDGVLWTTFDQDAFRAGLYVADPSTSSRTIDWDGEEVPFYDFAARLELNPRRAKLVVLDGQHRLEAIRALLRDPATKQMIESIEIPVCVVWMPEAKKGDGETMTRDYRELFVTVNSEPQRVSGHFLLLLRDSSYASMTIRQLADALKRHVEPGGWSRLHLLEWNTREAERVDQRTRGAFSVTTVSVVHDVLKDFLFDVPGFPAAMLRLKDREEDIAQVSPELDPDALGDRAVGLEVDKIVEEQIQTHLVPALTALFLGARPYAELDASISSAFSKLDEECKQHSPPFQSLKRYLERFIYNEREMFEAPTRAAYAQFKGWMSIPDESIVFFLAVYQQAMIRFWLNMAQLLLESNVAPADTARATVAALQAFVMAPKAREAPYLSFEHSYAQLMLWRGANVNYSSERAKAGWVNALGATLLRQDVRKAAVDALSQASLSAEGRAELDRKLCEMGERAARAYAERLKAELIADTRKSLGNEFGEVMAGSLREMKASNPKGFEKIILERGEMRFRETVGRFANALQVKTEMLVEAT